MPYAVLPAVLVLAGCGRVERTMTISSNPSGALVYLNGEEVGRTPLKHEFIWYGDYDVELRKEGYETKKVEQPVPAPVWQWIPFDLMADLLPGKKTDQHHYSYDLSPQRGSTDSGKSLDAPMRELRAQLESGEFTRKPATRPSTRPATNP